jgi:hypothetical protein
MAECQACLSAKGVWVSAWEKQKDYLRLKASSMDMQVIRELQEIIDGAFTGRGGSPAPPTEGKLSQQRGDSISQPSMGCKDMGGSTTEATMGRLVQGGNTDRREITGLLREAIEICLAPLQFLPVL